MSDSPAGIEVRTTLDSPVGPTAGLPGLALFLATMLAVLIWTAFDLWRTGLDSTWNSFGLAGLAWYLIWAFGLSWLITSTARPAPQFTAVATRVMLVGVGGTIVLSLMDGLDNGWFGIWTGYGVIAVAGFGFARYLMRVTGRRQILSSLLGAAGALVFWWITSTSYLSPELWYAPEDPEDGSVTWAQSESLLFSQPEKVDAAVAAMQPEAGEIPRAWFVGFAGYGGQRVFAEEIDLASKVIDQRYHTGKRAMRLINDRRDVQRYPLGTFSGLSRAIHGIAMKMNKDRDILILSLSSHGSEGEISVSNGALPLMELSSQRLGDLLRESGIRWKVIVISACHAGSFIDDLKDDSTIIITAAAADRTSFGCSDDRDLTYFGEAFYRDALPKAKSLREAFDLAKASIAAREQAEGVAPSLPQAVFSRDLEQKLAALEQ